MSTPLPEAITETALRWLRLTIEGFISVPQLKRSRRPERFGQRLARIRKARSLTQRDLARLTGISQRMIAYYEAQSEHPPTHLIPQLAKALSVGADELLGVEPVDTAPFEADVRVWRRLQKIQEMPPATRKTVLRLIDSVIDRYSKDSKKR